MVPLSRYMRVKHQAEAREKQVAAFKEAVDELIMIISRIPAENGGNEYREQANPHLERLTHKLARIRIR